MSSGIEENYHVGPTPLNTWELRPENERRRIEEGLAWTALKRRVSLLNDRVRQGKATRNDLECFYKECLGSDYVFPLQTADIREELGLCLNRQCALDSEQADASMPMAIDSDQGSEEERAARLQQKRAVLLQAIRIVSTLKPCWEKIARLQRISLALDGMLKEFNEHAPRTGQEERTMEQEVQDTLHFQQRRLLTCVNFRFGTLHPACLVDSQPSQVPAETSLES
jgi:hypothetical protein